MREREGIGETRVNLVITCFVHLICGFLSCLQQAPYAHREDMAIASTGSFLELSFVSYLLWRKWSKYRRFALLLLRIYLCGPGQPILVHICFACLSPYPTCLYPSSG